MADENNKVEEVSLERIDALMKVTDPKGWIGLIGSSILILLGVIWLFYGKIPTKVEGMGMLINAGGIKTVVANVNGRIENFNIKTGETLKKDQPIAVVSQLDLQNQISNEKQKLVQQEKANAEKEDMRKGLELKYNDEINALKLKLAAQQKLLKSGVVVEREALDTKERITSLQREIENLHVENLNDQATYKNMQHDLDSLQEKFQQNAVVRSPYDGRVVELEELVGNVVAPGTPLLTIESTDIQEKPLEGVFYVSVFEAKKIQSGMKVLIIPTIIKQEEYGSLIGTVRTVSPYPATVKGMMRYLQNDEMVKLLLTKGSQVEVSVDLKPSKETYSGYTWTSKKGPPIKIQSGTLCAAKITVKEKRPVELIVPKIKEILGIEE